MSTIRHLAFEYGVLAAIFAVGLLTGLIAWAATQPVPLPCGGHVTSACPFTGPALNNWFKGEPVIIYGQPVAVHGR